MNTNDDNPTTKPELSAGDTRDGLYEIRVDVKTEYIPTQSDPSSDRYVFAYHIAITNTGAIAAQLLDRRWLITDGEGGTQEIAGSGVIGQQPYLEPNQCHRYTSGTIMATKVGSMQGHYGMRAADGHEFKAVIAPFTLAYPGALH